MMAGTDPLQWEIWIAKVYFEDNPAVSKQRPVIVIDVTATYLYVTIKVTGTSPRANYSKEYAIKNWKYAGLNKESTARCSKIIRIPRSEMVHYIGTLHPVDIMGIKRIL